jgi:colicin import membrane protein
MYARTVQLGGDDGDYRRGLIFVLFSMAAHLLVLVVLIVSPNFSSSRRSVYPSVITVDLVSAGAPAVRSAPVRPSKAPSVQSAPPVKPIKKVVPTGKKSPRKTDFKRKRSLKKKTIKSSKMVDQAVNSVKKRVEEDQAKGYEDALQRLAQQVEKSGPVRTRGGARGGTAIGGGKVMDQLQVYKTEIIFHIQKNWSFSEQLAGSRVNLEALLAIRIMPNGEIRDVWFDKRSGNTYLDESARKALLKSSPLPPLPSGFREPFLEQGLRFTPSGIQ